MSSDGAVMFTLGVIINCVGVYTAWKVTQKWAALLFLIAIGLFIMGLGFMFFPYYMGNAL